MISGYNTGGQPVKVPKFHPNADIIFLKNFFFSPTETLGDRQKIDHYVWFRLYISHPQVRCPILYGDDCQGCFWGDPTSPTSL